MIPRFWKHELPLHTLIDKRKRTKNDPQNTKQNMLWKNKDNKNWTTCNDDGLEWYWRVSRLCSTSDTLRVTVKRYQHHQAWKSCLTPIYTQVNTCNTICLLELGTVATMWNVSSFILVLLSCDFPNKTRD